MLVCKKSLQNFYECFLKLHELHYEYSNCSDSLKKIYGPGNRALYFDTKNDTAFSFQKVLVSFGNQPVKYMGSFKYINSFVSLSVGI